MKGVVLVGGQGSRLRPITYDVPKAMVPLRNRPFMGYMMDFLRAGGLEGAVLSMGYLPDPIQGYFQGQNLNGFSINYAVEDHALGTAGGIKNTEAYLDGEPFVVVNGDVLSGMDLRVAIERHKESDALATIVLISVEDPTAYGLVEVDHDMLVHRFIEKPAADEVTTNLVNAGVYVLEPEVLAMIPASREVSIEREIFPELQESVRLLPPVSIAEECRIADLATIGGRSSLGKGSVVGEGAVVEGSILLDGAEVEAGAVVRGSVIGPRARVGNNSIVRGLSVLGAGCVVGEGNVLDQGIRVNPGVVVSPRSLRFYPPRPTTRR